MTALESRKGLSMPVAFFVPDPLCMRYITQIVSYQQFIVFQFARLEYFPNRNPSKKSEQCPERKMFALSTNFKLK